MSDIVLHQFAPDAGIESASPFCVKVQRALTLKGLEYAVKNVRPDALRRVNPEAGKVPVLDLRGNRIVDSTRILEAIDAEVPEPSLYPDGTAERALNHLLEDWADEALYWFAVYERWAVDAHFEIFAKGAFRKMPLAMRWVAPTVARRMARGQLREQGIGRLAHDEVLRRLDAHLDALEARLAGGDFLVDDRVRAADIAVFGVVRTLVAPYLEATRERVARRRALAAWLVRVDDVTRPAKSSPVELS